MIVITNNAVNNWCIDSPRASTALATWYKEVLVLRWDNPNQVRKFHAKVSIIGNQTVVFNIKNNEYRLVTDINYQRGVINLIWFGTHSEYDNIDVLLVKPNAEHSSRKK